MMFFEISKYWNYWNCPSLWKLFGCMFNRFGICEPTTSMTTDYTMSYNVSKREILSNYELTLLDNHPDQVLVFEILVPTEPPQNEDGYYIHQIFCCVDQF